MNQTKKLLLPAALAFASFIGLLARERLEAAPPVCASDSECAVGQYCIVALDRPVCLAPQAEGGPCKRDVVCASGKCEIPEGEAIGACTAPLLCTEDAGCPAGEFCIIALDPPVCRPPQANGQTCKRDVVCASGRCDMDAGVCAPPLCGADSDCGAGEFCIIALDPPVCLPPRALGESCKRDVVCASGRCDMDAGVCAPPLCGADSDCGAGEFCIIALDPPVCLPPRALGESCKRDVVCASGRCDMEAGVCAPPLCGADSDCGAGEFCIIALDPPVCLPPRALGESCKRDVVCASGRCAIAEGTDAGVCAPSLCANDSECKRGEYCIIALDPPVCLPPLPAGSACKRDIVCASGTCVIPEGTDVGTCG